MTNGDAGLHEKWPISSIFCFVVLVSLLSIPVSYIQILSGNVEAYDLLVDRSIMWCPAAAALITCVIYGIKTDRLALSFPKPRFALLGYAIPFLVFAIAYSCLALSHLVPMSFQRFYQDAENNLHLGALSGVVGFGLIATIAVILDCAATMGEEIGWRGFLVPALAQRLSFFWTALISGLIWALWHFPAIFDLGFGGVGSATTSAVLFTIDCTLLAFILAWLRLKSGSIWPTIIYHASNNTFSYKLFEKLPIVSGVMAERIGKILVELCIVMVILAVFSRRGLALGKASEFRGGRLRAGGGH